MVQKSECEPRLNTLDNEGVLKRPMTRRGLVGLAVAAGVGSISLGGCSNETSVGEDVSVEEADPNSRIVSAEQAVDNIKAFSVPQYLYADRPWANPEGVFDLSVEELRKRSVVDLRGDTLTFGELEQVRRALESIGSVGGEKKALLDARSQGNPIGERDKWGNILGDYPAYIKERFVSDMVDALFPGTAGEMNDGIKDYFSHYAKAYDIVLTDPRWVEYLTLFVDTAFAEEKEGNPEVNIIIGRPVPGGDWKKAKNVHRGRMILGITKDTRYRRLLGVEYFEAKEVDVV